MNSRTPIVWVWRAFKLIHCQKGMRFCAYISLKLIELEVRKATSEVEYGKTIY